MEKQRERDRIFKLAELDLAKHEIRKLSGDQDWAQAWLCYTPKSGFHSFHVVMCSGAIIVYGDVGDNLLSIDSYPSLDWLRRHVSSVDYMLSRIAGAKASRFSTSAAMEYLRQLEDRKLAEDIEMNWIDEESGEDFLQAVQGQDDGGELVREAAEHCFDYPARDIWTIACLQKFVELMDSIEKKK